MALIQGRAAARELAALRGLIEASTHKPHRLLPYQGVLIQSLYEAGLDGEALEIAPRVLAFNPNHPRTLLVSAQAESRLRNRDAAPSATSIVIWRSCATPTTPIPACTSPASSRRSWIPRASGAKPRWHAANTRSDRHEAPVGESAGRRLREQQHCDPHCTDHPQPDGSGHERRIGDVRPGPPCRRPPAPSTEADRPDGRGRLGGHRVVEEREQPGRHREQDRE